jgi:aldose 1-epimerase
VDRLPTGQQHELRHGDQTAVVVELGGALRHYAAADRSLLDGFGPEQRIDGGRGQLLVPWPNRIRDGRYRWQGQEHQLALSEPEAHNAIHGLLRWTSWALRYRDDARVVVGATVWPQQGYPFLLDVTAEYTLSRDGLSVTVTAENVGTEAAPYGAGQHPYFTVGTDLVDDAVLTVPAGQWLKTDERGTPVGAESVAGSTYDFREPRPIGGQRLDAAFADLERDGSGMAVVRLGHPSGRHGFDVWLGDGADYVQVYTGDTLPDPARRRRGVAIEPMSCPPDAFRSGTGLVAFNPGARHELHWGVTPW